MKNNITLYGCGGTGVNIVTPYILNPQKDRDGYATISPSLIDTSESNISDDRVKKVFYKIKLEKNAEGSGSIRSENVDEIRQQVPTFISEYKPGDLSIVVASANGGSGSTIAPVLVSELVKRQHPVITVLLVDDNNQKSIENAQRTLVSFDTMAKKSGVPFVAALVPNVTLASANNLAGETIAYLSMLFSNENHGLDNADLRNFLNFTKVTQVQPGLAGLLIADKLTDDYNRNPISLAMLHTTQEAQQASRGKFVTGYSCEGIFRSDVDVKDKTVYFTIEYDDVLDVMNHLADKAESYNTTLSGVLNRTIKLKDEHASVDDDGLVL